MFRLLFLTILVFFCSQSALAAEIAIEDTTGVVRHVSEVQSPANIKFTVTDHEGKPIDGAIINLSLKGTDEKRQAVSVGGVVEFLDIPAGSWIVSTDSSKLLFTQIIVSDLGSNALANAGGSALITSGAGDSTAGIVGGTSAGAGAGLSTGALVGVGVLAAGGITGIVVAIDESGSNSKTELSPAS